MTAGARGTDARLRTAELSGGTRMRCLIAATAIAILIAAAGSASGATPASKCHQTVASLFDAAQDKHNTAVVKRKYVTLTRHYVTDSTGTATAATGTVTVNPQYRRTVRIVSAMFNVVTFDPGVPGRHKKVPAKITHDDRVTMKISLRENQSVAVVAYTESKRCG
jgi:hypothetical protein